MKSATSIQNPRSNFFIKYKIEILSLILSIYTLPGGFFAYIDNNLGGSWERAINYSIKNKLVFGDDFIFTYGPLGYLSTRHTQYISNIFLFLADVFICTCFYHFFYKCLSRSKGWFFILLVAVFYFKGSEFSETLFLLFIVFTILNLKNNFSNHFELICCGISGIVGFFVKINYGVIAIVILFILLLFLLVKNRKSFLILFSTSLFVFFVIYTNVNINIIDYIKYGMPVIANYADAMTLEVKPFDKPYISAIILITVFGSTILYYFRQSWKQNKLDYTKIISVILLMLMLFLLYKNAFTRADEHTYGMFFMFPLFIVFVMLILDFRTSRIAKIICICSILVSDFNIPLPHGTEGNGFIYNATLAPTMSYFSTVFKKQDVVMDPKLKIPDDKLKIIGKSTIDLLPIDITVLLLNNLNYSPRPIVQSYSVYSPILDSLNANHFYKEDRPKFVMVSNWSMDNRYAIWDESITKAVLHLNYKYVDFVSINNDTALANNTGCYLLLKSKEGVKKYTKFEKLYEKTINLEDTVHFNFPDDTPIYMTADIEYNALGKIKNILYQPPILTVSLFLDSACTWTIYVRAIRPILKEPVLISKAICFNTDFKDFIDGNSKKDVTIKAFAFHAIGRGCKKKIKLTFYKFSNY